MTTRPAEMTLVDHHGDLCNCDRGRGARARQPRLGLTYNSGSTKIRGVKVADIDG